MRPPQLRASATVKDANHFRERCDTWVRSIGKRIHRKQNPTK